MNKKHFMLLGLIVLQIVSCKKSTEPYTSQNNTLPIPPVYITVAGHIEDTAVYAKCNSYPDFRQKLLTFAALFGSTGATMNLQIDYEFFSGTVRCESEAMRSETNGLNVIDYLVQQYQFEIDAHQEGGWEEGQDNYADVRYIGGTLTSEISEVVGGLVWNDPDQFARLAQGESGLLTPDFKWYPEILTLAVHLDHHSGDFSNDDFASGMWRPKGAGQNYWVHDSNQRMICVGPGEHSDWGRNEQKLSTSEFVQSIADGLEFGNLDRTKMYTVTLAVPQSIIFHEEEHQKLIDKLDALAPLVEAGKAQYVTYSEAVEIWKTEYDSVSNIYFRDGVTLPQDGGE